MTVHTWTLLADVFNFDDAAIYAAQVGVID